jgi:hypothetical protein
MQNEINMVTTYVPTKIYMATVFLVSAEGLKGAGVSWIKLSSLDRSPSTTQVGILSKSTAAN